MTDYVRKEELKEFFEGITISVAGRTKAEAISVVLQAIYNGAMKLPTTDAEPVIRCKDCKYYRDGDCWHEWDNDGQIYYQSVINEPNPDDYCSRAERREE